MNKVSGPSSKPFYNRSLERALQIMIAFGGDRKSLTLGQLSDALDLSKATVFRLCATLVNYGFLRQDREQKQYSLGVKLFELGSIVASSFSLAGIAAPHIARLQLDLGKTVFLGVLDEGELLYLDKREGLKEPISFTSNVGSRRPPYWGMLGLTLMAFLQPEEVDALLVAHPLVATTKDSFPDAESLKTALRSIRDAGYAVDEGRSIEGVGGVGAPIRDYTGKIAAALGIGFIHLSVDPDQVRRITTRLLQAASAISADAGYRVKSSGQAEGGRKLS